MGYETKCRVRVADNHAGTVREAALATVLLETDDLIVRGEARVRVPRASIERITSRSGVVTITSPAATISLSLGAEAAAKWRKKLAEPPKLLIDKLDVKPEFTVWLHGVTDANLIAQLEERVAKVLTGSGARPCNVAIVQIDDDGDLERIDRAAAAISRDGAVWAVHPKGKDGVADTTIFGRAKAIGLTYTKVARVSDVLSAEKLVWPRASRGT
ncbi:MAG TPA: hypothetical protein VH277_06100 [Gemmatimonadaceae bacterium]|jgi:hypothetical protein|nr:hypothetical protein [Gemmatimonadaceae bacterium]